MKNLLKKIVVALSLVFLFSGAQALAIEIPFTPEDAGTVQIDVHDGDSAGFDDEFSQDGTQVNKAGVMQIRSALLNVYHFLRYVIVAVAIFTLSASGIYLVSAGKNIEEETSKAKLNIKWVVYGLVIFLMLDVFVGTFFGHGDKAGTIFNDLSNNAILYETGAYFSQEAFHLLDFLTSFISLVGVLIIIISAITIVGSFGNEGVISNQKKVSMVVVGGLIIIALAKTIVSRVLFGVTGAGYNTAGQIVITTNRGDTILPSDGVGFLVDAQAGTNEIIGIANYILGFVGILALVMFVYGGLRMVLARGDDGEVSKAKSIMISAVTGVVISICSFTLVATFINPA